MTRHTSQILQPRLGRTFLSGRESLNRSLKANRKLKEADMEEQGSHVCLSHQADCFQGVAELPEELAPLVFVPGVSSWFVEGALVDRLGLSYLGRSAPEGSFI
jgi:hypothetical protein